jgi:hypothetical protein
MELCKYQRKGTSKVSSSSSNKIVFPIFNCFLSGGAASLNLTVMKNEAAMFGRILLDRGRLESY